MAIDIIQYKKVFGNSDYPTRDSNMIDELQPAVAAPRWPFSYKPATTAGLNLGYYGGQMLVDGVLTAVADSTVALTASQTNYVEATRAGVVSTNITGFTAGRIPLYTAVTGGAAISTLTDVRNFNQPHFNRLALATTGGTTTLSVNQARVQAIDVTGTLVSNATLEVPAVPWEWAIYNGTTGAFTLTVKVSGQTGVGIAQGDRVKSICDGVDVRALAADVAGAIHAATSKATPVDADELGLVDSAAAWVLKKLTWANLKTTFIATALTWTAAQTFRAANAVRSEAAATQDAMILAGRAGGTSSYAVTLTPAPLTASRTATLPDATDTLVGKATTDTLTNKRVTARVGSTTSSATPTINTDNVDVYKLTAQTVAITSFTTNLSGTPTDDQVLIIHITGTAARAITWGASFESSTVVLPTTTVSTNMLVVGFLWNAVTSKWRCVAII